CHTFGPPCRARLRRVPRCIHIHGLLTKSMAIGSTYRSRIDAVSPPRVDSRKQFAGKRWYASSHWPAVPDCVISDVNTRGPSPIGDLNNLATLVRAGLDGRVSLPMSVGYAWACAA